MQKVVNHILPVNNFEKAERIFFLDNGNNSVLKYQYDTKRTKREKIKFLRFMGYLTVPGKQN